MLPAPRTTAQPVLSLRVSGAGSPERRIPRRTQAAGSRKIAASSEIPGGILRAASRTARSRRRTSSLKPPGSSTFSRKTGHIVSLPRRQSAHFPHGTWWGATTRSPGPKPPTPSPRASTVPMTSCPSTAPAGAVLVWSLKRSVPQSPQPKRRRTISPGPGAGIWRVSSRVVPSPAQATTWVVDRDSCGLIGE